MCSKVQWDGALESQVAYYPPTFESDGNFTHATSDPRQLLAVANHYYTSSPDDDWICVELDAEALRERYGIVTKWESPLPVGDTGTPDRGEEEKEGRILFPHVYGGIPAHLPGVVLNVYPMKRSETPDGGNHRRFLCIPGIVD